MSKNYNNEIFNDKNNELTKVNNRNNTNFSTSGRCNTCKYFTFSCGKCNLTGEKITLTYTSDTSKGTFINYIKPSSCMKYQLKRN